MPSSNASSQQAGPRAAASLRLIAEVASAVAEASDLSGVLHAALEAICAESGWVLGQAWVPTPDGARVECHPAWHGTTPDLEEFHAFSGSIRCVTGKGLPGRAYWSGRPAWIPDVTIDPEFPRAPVAAALGLRTGAAFPVRGGDEIVAVLEFFRREAGEPDESLMEAISAASSLVGPHFLRIRAEEACRVCEERYRLLAEGASDMIARVASDESIRYVSAASLSLTGFAPEEMIGRPWSMFVHPDDRAKVKRVRETAPDVFSLQYRGRRKAGDWTWFESTGRTIRDAVTGAVQEFSTVTRDITERKHLEAGLLRSQKMEAIGRLAGGVAHDFNNLLTVITGYVELAIKTLPVGDPIRADLAEVKKAGDRAASLTRQLLAFGRSQVLTPQPLDLNLVVLEMERMLRRLIGEDIELATALAPVLGEVRADPGQVEQVIMNLVVNARDAIQQAGSARRKSGRLSIETSEVDLDEVYARQHVGVKPGRYVMLAVSDNGRGMDAETLSHLFEPFFTTKGLGEGTGLGLSTVYGIVRQSGGHIWVYSEPSVGSTFRVYFPRAHRGRRPTQRKKERDGDLRGAETILLVEDEEMVRSLACEILGRFGYDVIPAKNARDAVKASRGCEGRIHLLVTDVVMPRVGGPELASQLRHEREGIRVLYMSGYTQNALLHQGALPADTILLQKPFTADALARKVREALA